MKSSVVKMIVFSPAAILLGAIIWSFFQVDDPSMAWVGGIIGAGIPFLAAYITLLAIDRHTMNKEVERMIFR